MEALDNWTWARIGDLVSEKGIFVDGDWVESKDQDPKGDVRLIQLGDIGDGKYNNRSSRFLTSLKAQELKCTFLKKDDLLIARMPDPLGRACIFPGDSKPAVTVVDVCVVRTCCDIDHRWLMHMINSPEFRRRVSALQSGSTRKRISRKNLATILLPVAPLVEQRAIVAKIEALFSELDKGVEQLQTIKQQLKQYRQAVLKAAFEGKLTAAWRAEQQAAGNLPTADDLLEQIKKERKERYQQQLRKWELAVIDWEAEGGRESGRKKPAKPSIPKAASDLAGTELAHLPVLPGQWRWVALGQLCESVRNGISEKPSDSPPGFPILRINAVRPMSVHLDETRYHDRPRDEVETFFIQSGDLLFTRYNGSPDLVGVCGMVRGCSSSILYPDKLIRVSLAAPFAVSAFVEIAANSGASRDFVVSRARTTAGQTGVSGEDVRNIPLPLPPLPELERIVDEASFRLSAIDDIEKAVGCAMNQAETLRQSILKKALEGRLLSDTELAAVRNDAQYEPADKLLERIRAKRGLGEEPSGSRRSGTGGKTTGPDRTRREAAETRSEA